jgi:hypothetical protein
MRIQRHKHVGDRTAPAESHAQIMYDGAIEIPFHFITLIRDRSHPEIEAGRWNPGRILLREVAQHLSKIE